jgi:SAM-dependent methyltransferase
VDGNARCKPDQLIDLNVGLWPLFGKFDVVVASHVLEHVDSPIKLVHEVHRALNPGGRLLVVVPNAWSDGGLCNPLHRNYFTMHTFVYFRADTYNQPRTAGYLANEGYPIADWASVKVGVIPEPAWSENPRIEFGSRHYINVLSEVCAVLTKRS